MFVNISTSQHIPFGKMLCHLYYSNQTLLGLAPGRSGYPHNGGEHTLTLKADKGDIIAFLDLLLGAYPFVVKEIVLIKDAVAKWVPNAKSVWAAELFSQHIYDYHETYTYTQEDKVITFHPDTGYTHREFALQAIHHLSIVNDWNAKKVKGIVKYDDFMSVEIFSDDDISIYMERLRREQVDIAKMYGDAV